MNGLLKRLGVYGFDAVEPVILAALVTEDPLLLIGGCGTGKTYLLNSISEALGMEHRHYNASTINFDDLVGFPFPDKGMQTVRFLPTPATIWNAESVLVDEISRCKPEHQNRLFSIIYERKVQGIPLERLRFRFAAMNPCTDGETDAPLYAGTEPLDQALADRFAFIVSVPDWRDLDDEARLLIADPRGEGAISNDGGALRAFLEERRRRFATLLADHDPRIEQYACGVVSAFDGTGVRLSPRRCRLLVRNILAVLAVSDDATALLEQRVQLTLSCSLPHAAWGAPIPATQIEAAHRRAWDMAFPVSEQRRWLARFESADRLVEKIRLLWNECPDAETGSIAVTQALSALAAPRALAFAAALYPAVATGGWKVTPDAVVRLGNLARQVMEIRESLPDDRIKAIADLVKHMAPVRQARARQLLLGICTSSFVREHDPDSQNAPASQLKTIEKEYHECIQYIASIQQSQ